MDTTPIPFWSAPRLPSADFAPEDPLAIDYVSQQIGNRLWPGFTSRTGRAGYYLMTAYGLWLAHRLAGEHGLAPSDDNIRSIFERFEKLWALAVCHSYSGRISTLDGVRGQRGVERAYDASWARPTLDYKLLSRQLELGALGAYLTSLRAHGLVAAERLRPTPLGYELATLMWSDDGDDEPEAFVKEALSPGHDEVPQQVGRTTLASLGGRCRLSRIYTRPLLQGRLWERLFASHPPPESLAILTEMAGFLVAAYGQGVTDTQGFVASILKGRLGTPSPAAREAAEVAWAFGQLSAILRTAFDRAYSFLLDRGLQAAWSEVADAAFPPESLARLEAAMKTWGATPAAAKRIANLPAHGAGLVSVLRALSAGSAVGAFDSLMELHQRVQRDRGKTCGWLRRDGGLALLELGGYSSWHLDETVWVVNYKVGTMASLLSDLGRFTP